jgi:hypothetical protein
MKYITILGVVFSFQAAMAQSISSDCLQSSIHYMSRTEGLKYCDNVANNCFVALRRSRGFYEAREKCLNIASSCFGEIYKGLNADDAINSCQDVSNRCYKAYRVENYSIKDSIKKCRSR